MGEFGITTARRKLGFTPATSTPLNVDVRGTGGDGAMVGDALLAGASLFKQYDVQQANTQLSESQRKAQAELNDFKIRMKGNLDPDTYQADYDQTLQRIGQHAPKNKRGAQAYNLWVGSQSPKWQMGVSTAQLARADDNWQTEVSANIASIASGDDPGALKKTIDMVRLKQEGPSPLDNSDAAKLLITARTANIGGQVANLKKAGMAGDAEAFGQARELVESSEALSAEDKLTALKQINTDEGQFEIRQRKAKQAQKELVQQEVWTDLQSDNYAGALEKINTSNLPVTGEGGKDWWTNKIEKSQQAAIDGKDNPLNQTSTDKYFELRRGVENGLVRDEADISKWVGQGISVADYEKLTGMIKQADSPLNSRTAKRAGTFIDTFKATQPEQWLEMRNDYDKFYNNSIDRTGQEPTDQDSEAWLKSQAGKLTKQFWVNDRPDEEVRAELVGIPLEGKRDFVRASGEGLSTTKWIDQWRKKKKKITPDIQVEYLQMNNNDIDAAKAAATRDGYK